MTEAEWLTRKIRIDTKLKANKPAWEIVPFVEGLDVSQLTNHAVTEFPTANGPADYALFVGGQLLGIVEAKKVSVNPQNVLEQAKRYAAGAENGPGNWNGYKVPFLYSTNGELIWFIDVRKDKPSARQISNFHSADALSHFFHKDSEKSFAWLQSTPINRIDRMRPYQEQAIKSIEGEVIKGSHSLLVSMATGSGKTYLTVAQIYRLMASGCAKRILFLVDRKALAAQAVREFASFNTPAGNKFNQEYEVYSQRFHRDDFGDDKPFDPKVLPNEYLTNPKPGQTFVYVSTIQRMTINLLGREKAFPQWGGDPETEDDADKLDIPIHAFDLIIADECHRGYTASETGIWRETINYFDAIKIGLTATPAAHTVAIFGNPVFRYGVEQAIRDGYLVDYEAVSIKSNVRMNGVFLKEGEEIGKIDTVTGEEVFDEVEDERKFSAEEVERNITSLDSNRKIIEEIAKYAYKHEKETGHFPKILIFATNDISHISHADQLVNTCREVFRQGDGFVQKITGNPNVDRPLQRIREFRNRPHPKIVVTVDMLSTGVDIPALEFIVFLRPVKSRILWEQMLGRGTRRCDEINKDHFTIFDCFDGTLIKYFKDVSNFKIEEPGKAVSILEVIENIWQNIDRDYNVRILVKRLRRIEKSMSAEAREEFSKFIKDGDIGTYAAELPALLKTDFNGAMKLLRDKDFQDLLVNYHRAKRSFWKSYEAHDVVSSTEMGKFGTYDKPEDYLKAFAQFVHDNAEKIEALKIVLNRPKDWSPDALDELRQVLRQNDYSEKELQKAHKAASHKNVADIISIVRHAAADQEPLYTAEERVSLAIEKIIGENNFSPEQLEWLNLIKQHMVTNLTLAELDFDLLPLFSRSGGISRASRVFGASLLPLIQQVNSTVASYRGKTL